MPYRLDGNCVKKDTGETVKCHDSRAEAESHLRALYANVEESHKEKLSFKEHTGVMVALFLPPHVADMLYQATAAIGITPEPAEEYHITLAYLGKMPDLEKLKGIIRDTVQAFAQESGTILGTISGIGRFNTDEGDGTSAFYASFDSPALASFRAMLLEDFKAIGIEISANHGFTPHITLAYLPLTRATPDLKIPPIDVAFHDLVLAWGDERITEPLPLEAQKAANYGARAGETIAGRLVRGQDGKFSSSGSAPTGKPKTDAELRADVRGRPKPKKPSRRSRARGRRAAKPAKGRKPAVTPEQRQQQRADAQAENRKKNRNTVFEAVKGQLQEDQYYALMDFADGKQPEADLLQSMLKDGLVDQGRDGIYRLTDAGRRFTAAADRGDPRDALDALSRGRDRVAEGQEREQDRQRRAQARDTRRQQQEQRRQEIARRRAMRERRLRGRRKEVLTVYKDANGNDRWLAVSSTAFRDRDKEIVSLAALQKDIDRTYKAIAEGRLRNHGPLRFWHVPGLDIGDCDYRVLAGRSLIESGTFRKKEYARLIRPGDQMSLGFMHPISQPDANGIFTDIYSFERSITPAGRASNTLTRITVKEVQMLTKEKQDEYLARGGDLALLESLLAEQQTTEKAAEAAGVSYKEDATPPTVSTDAEQPAPDPAPEPEAEATTEKAMEMAAAPTGDVDDGPLLTDAEMDMIGERVAMKLAPMFNVKGMIDDLKSSFGGQMAKKDDDIASLKEALAQSQALTANLQARLANLEGDQTSAAKRSVARPDLGAAAFPALKGAEPKADPINDFFADVPGGSNGNRQIQAIE